MNSFDQWMAACLTLLAVWIVASGLDDLLLDLTWLWQWTRSRSSKSGRGGRDPDTVPPRGELSAAPEKRIAIFVPLWREDAVIGRMLEYNIGALRYHNYDFFVGAYPNDEPTLRAVRKAASRYPHVHLVQCPHDGPTSKADCLNWIYPGMLAFEEERNVRFELVVLHDAEDVIHADSLSWMNWFADRYDMVQVPVLPLPARLRDFTRALYCDEFAEFQLKDMPARQAQGAFLPSSGVGAAYRRAALEKLAAHSGQLFDSVCLTEDYDVGLRLSELGCRQVFVPIHFLSQGDPLATREIFPGAFRKAVRQRSRWVIGIALQTWERCGWGCGWLQAYWFWRDRKGLIGSPAGFLANILFLFGAAKWVWCGTAAAPWVPSHAISAPLIRGTLFFLFVRLAVRAGCTARIYGMRLALFVPLRAVWGNWINFFATISALRQYFGARLRGVHPAWRKTEHSYPSRAALMPSRRPLGEVLVAAGQLAPAELAAALDSQPPGLRLGTHLVRLGRLTEQQVYAALGAQHNVPFTSLEADRLPPIAVRSLPAGVVEKWRVLPFKIEQGQLHVAAADVPGEEMQRDLRNFTRLKIRFHFVTPGNLEELHKTWL